jgi:hypothetical protein
VETAHPVALVGTAGTGLAFAGCPTLSFFTPFTRITTRFRHMYGSRSMRFLPVAS